MSMYVCESTRRRRWAMAAESGGSSVTARYYDANTSRIAMRGRKRRLVRSWKTPTLALGQLLERIEDLHARAPEVPIVPGDDSQPVAAGRGGDVAVRKGHSQPGFVEG